MLAPGELITKLGKLFTAALRISTSRSVEAVIVICNKIALPPPAWTCTEQAATDVACSRRIASLRRDETLAR